MEGFVTKRGHLITNWKVRWFKLEGGEIKYYKDRTQQIMKGRYILQKDSVVSFHSDMGLNKNIILIFTASHPFRKKALYFSCDSPESKESWMRALTERIEALKTGMIPVPAGPNTILGNAIQSVDRISSTITKVFTGNMDGSDEYIDPDVEELLKGRPIARTTRSETSRSADRNDSRTPPSSKSVRPLGKPKRISKMPSAETNGNLANTEVDDVYTAADYDSSDTDGSASEQYPAGRGRCKSSGSDVSKARPPSSTDQGGLASEALGSTILRQKSDKAENPVYYSPSTSTSTLTGRTSMADDTSTQPSFSGRASLPRVSQILTATAVAEEVAALNHKKKTSSTNTVATNNGKIVQSPVKAVGECRSKQTASSPRTDSTKTVDTFNTADSQSKTLCTASADALGGVDAGSAMSSSSSNSSDYPWIPARTAEGELYYYHKVTRLARWDKPESHIADAVEGRMRELDLATQRNLQERKETIERDKKREHEAAQIKQEKMSDIEKTVRNWSVDKQRGGRELSFPELLRDLAFILPSDLLLVVYDSSYRVVLDALQDFQAGSSPSEVKKAYLRVVRFVHPDKLPPELDVYSKLLVERVFIHLTQKYDLYRKAHDL